MLVQKNEAVDLLLTGAFLLKPLIFEDDRGAFYKLFTDSLLLSKGAGSHFSEQNLSVSKKGVIRGLHYQRGQFSQAKIVMCTKGEIQDVIVDLRKSSSTFGKWASAVLSDKNRHAMYAPRGFAHGFLVNSDEAHVLYMCDSPYSPKEERGIMYNDSALAIKWQFSGKVALSQKDLGWPSFNECEKFD